MSQVSPWPSFSTEEIEAVAATLRSGRVNYWTGDEGRKFEREFADMVGTSYAVALANGTLALDVALRALDIGPGDEVVTTPRTFVASASCIVNAGATPIFADVDPDSGNISAETVEKVLSSRTKAVIAVHLGGWPCDMDPLTQLADRHGFALIEDCAQAHGARYNGSSVGSLGTIGAWSFCQDKIMTTGGEGGMVTTQDPDLWSRMWSFKDHGKSWDAVYQRQHPPGFRWLHESFGTNWRMLEMQAVIGRIQVGMLEEWVAARARNAARLAEVTAEFTGALLTPKPMAEHRHAYYRFYTYVRPDGLRPDWSRDRIIEALNARGIPAFQGSCSEVYLEKAFQNARLEPPARLPVARDLGETSIAFLTHPTLTEADMNHMCDGLTAVLVQAAR